MFLQVRNKAAYVTFVWRSELKRKKIEMIFFFMGGANADFCEMPVMPKVRAHRRFTRASVSFVIAFLFRQEEREKETEVNIRAAQYIM